jgi:hypothetical protein
MTCRPEFLLPIFFQPVIEKLSGRRSRILTIKLGSAQCFGLSSLARCFTTFVIAVYITWQYCDDLNFFSFPMPDALSHEW